MIDIATVRSYGDKYLRYLKFDFGIISFSQISHESSTLNNLSDTIIINSITNLIIK